MFPMTEDTQQYFTLIYGILDTKNRRFTYVCAGHPPPILLSPGQQAQLCDAPSLPIGLFEDETYTENTIVLEPGARVYLYSDGVLEAMNPERKIFSEARLRSTIQDYQSEGLQDSVHSIVKSVLAWTETNQIHDDLSILSVEFK